MANDISCPVDHIKVSESRVRLTAALVFLVSLTYLFTGSWWVAMFLTVDFFLRAFGFGTYSPLQFISGWLEMRFSLTGKMVDRAPKIFAARVGFIFADCLLITGVLGIGAAADFIASVLLVFSFLESALGFCAGCYAYSFLRRFFPRAIA